MIASNPRKVFLQNDMEIRAAKSEGTHPGKTEISLLHGPFPGSGIDLEGQHRKIDVRIRAVEIRGGGQHFIVKGKDGF